MLTIAIGCALIGWAIALIVYPPLGWAITLVMLTAMALAGRQER